jgi:biopolymer transport protein TolR
LPEEMMRDHQPLILSVDAAGSYYLNIGSDEEKAIEEGAVIERVSTVLRREPQTPVLVKADQNVPYGRVVTGMVLLQQAGAEKVGFITDPVETRDKKKR